MKEDKMMLVEKLLQLFGKKEVEKFYQLLRKDNSLKNQRISSDVSEDTNQLKIDPASSLEIYTNIDLLITFIAKKLSYGKLSKLLLFIGEDLTQKGSLDSAHKVFSYVLNLSQKKSSRNKTMAWALYGLGDVYSRQAIWDKSNIFLNKAKLKFKSFNDNLGIAKCENILGTISVELGELDSAKHHFENALSLLNEKSEILRGMIESNIGILENIKGNYDQAYVHFQRALYTFEKDENYQRLSEVHHNLGMVCLAKQNFKYGLKEFDRAFMYANKSEIWQIMCIACANKAYIYCNLKDYLMANAFALKAMEIAYKINDRLSIADIYKIKGIIEKHRKNYSLSENYFNTSLRINIELENILNQAETLYEMGFFYKNTGDFKQSKLCFNRSLNKYKFLKIEKKVKEIKKELEI